MTHASAGAADAAADATADILVLRDITRRFGNRLAVDRASLTLSPGESVCLVGGNGAGKSTLLALAAGILSPDEGQMLICNRNPSRERLAARQLTGYMGDHPLLYDALSGRENLQFFARLYGLSQPRQRIDQLLRQVGLSDRADDAAGALSSGMRRRLDMARALLHTPPLMLLDEPMNSLDEQGRRLVEQLAAGLPQQRAAMLWTAHQPPPPSMLVSRIIYIADGRLSSQPVVNHDQPVTGDNPPPPAAESDADCREARDRP